MSSRIRLISNSRTGGPPYSGHDLSKVKSIHANKIGCLGKLPVELIVYIFDATDLEAVIMLGTTNAQLFVIGYRSIVKKVKAYVLIDNWAYDRIISIGDGESALPDGFLSTPEKHRLVQWAAEHEVILELNRCWGLPFPDDTTTDLEELDFEDERDPVNVVAEYERQDFHLFAYASLMPSLLKMHETLPRNNALRHLHRRSLDMHRSNRIKVELLGFEPCEYEGKNWVLFNITKKEFMRNKGTNIFDDTIPMLIAWGYDDGPPPIKREGDWAGDRLAMLPEHRFNDILEKEEGWVEKKLEGLRE